jgi:hypothetical protein
MTNIKNIIKANPKAKFETDGTNSLTYKHDEPLVIFYQLREIKVNTIGSKGTGDYKIDVSLGNRVDSQEVIP